MASHAFSIKMLSLKQISIISTIYLYDDMQKNVPYCNALQYFLRHTISPPPSPQKRERERERNNNRKQKKTNKQSVQGNI